MSSACIYEYKSVLCVVWTSQECHCPATLIHPKIWEENVNIFEVIIPCNHDIYCHPRQWIQSCLDAETLVCCMDISRMPLSCHINTSKRFELKKIPIYLNYAMQFTATQGNWLRVSCALMQKHSTHVFVEWVRNTRDTLCYNIAHWQESTKRVPGPGNTRLCFVDHVGEVTWLLCHCWDFECCALLFDSIYHFAQAPI